MCAPHAAASAFTGDTTYLYEHAYLCFHCRCENAACMCVNGCVWIGGLPMRLLFKFRSFPRIPCLNGKSGRGMKARRKQSQNPARQHISTIRACGYLSNTSAIRKQSASSVYRNAPCYPSSQFSRSSRIHLIKYNIMHKSSASPGRAGAFSTRHSSRAAFPPRCDNTIIIV